MAIMARTMGKALQELDPLRKEFYAANTEVLEDQLEVLHGYLKSVLAPVQGRRLLVFHPAYGYFCDAYGLQQMAVEREGKAPKGKELSELIQTAQKEQIRAIFTQPRFDKRTAQTVASAMGARVISFDPFPKDYISYFQTMGAVLRRQLQEESVSDTATE
jgi:zinc transport system substrate-binding protein